MTRLVTKEADLRYLDLMLSRGTYVIKRITVSQPLNRDAYVIAAPGACRGATFVPVELRPEWAKKYFEETFRGQSDDFSMGNVPAKKSPSKRGKKDDKSAKRS